MSQFADLLTVNGNLVISNYAYGFYTKAKGSFRHDSSASFLFNKKYDGFTKENGFFGFTQA